VVEVGAANHCKNVMCKSCEISWYMRNEAAIEHIKTQNTTNYLSSVEFDVTKPFERHQ
jgi:hypothetical protein